MNDSRSFIEPFKSRLLEVFNASSSGDNPYRNPPPPPGKRPKKAEPAEAGWDSESEHLFEDFLSLDEEKITNGLARAKVHKALDRKYRRSSRSEQLEEETLALEDVLDADLIAPEITLQKLDLIAVFLTDVQNLIANRYPGLSQRADLLSRPVWLHLSQQGLHPRFLLNLFMIAHYYQSGQEAYDNPQARLYLQMHVQHLNLGLRAEEIEQHLEKHTLDLERFSSMLDQTLHALERQSELLGSLENLLQIKCEQAQTYFLQRLQEPYLDVNSRLARFYLLQKYRGVCTAVYQLAERLQARQKVEPEQAADLMQRWLGHEQALASLFVLQAAKTELPLIPAEMETELVAMELDPALFAAIDTQLNLEQLEKWVQDSVVSSLESAPGFVSDQVLEQNWNTAVAEEDWSVLEKWALLKASYGLLFRQSSILPLGRSAEAFLPLHSAS